jgi:hypothetical protein
MTVPDRRARRRQRRWSSPVLRGAIVGIGLAVTLLMGLVVPTSASACTDAEARNHMTCSTPPIVSRCVLGAAGAGAIGAIAGGPVGFLAGLAGGLLGCGVSTIG